MGILKKSKTSELDTAIAKAISAYNASHPAEAPEPSAHPAVPPHVARILRAHRPAPASEHPEKPFLDAWRQEARQPVSSASDPGVPSSAPARSGAGSLSSELPPILASTHLTFLRDELGRIAGATANDGVRRCEMKAQRDSEGRISAVYANGVKFQVQRDAEGKAYALAS